MNKIVETVIVVIVCYDVVLFFLVVLVVLDDSLFNRTPQFCICVLHYR